MPYKSGTELAMYSLTFPKEYQMSLRRTLKSSLLAGVVFGLSSIAPAFAGIVVSESNFPGGNNVVFLPCSLPSGAGGPAPTVLGCLQNSNSTIVSLSGAENMVISGGQATLDSADGFFTSGSIMLQDPSKAFSALGFNVNSIADRRNPVSISFSVDYIDPINAGTVASAAFSLGVGGNQFSFIADSGWLMTKVRYQVNVANAIEDIRQIRFEATDRPVDVPLPGSAALLVLGALGLGLKRRKN
jgi:hypothetical protein